MTRRWQSWWKRGWILVAVGVFLGCGPEKKPNPCRNPQFVEVMKEEGAAYYHKGRYIDALRAVKDAEACNPKDPELYYWMGLIYFRRDKHYDAIECLKKSLKINPEYTESHMALGVIYLGLERWDEAIVQFEFAADDDLFTRPWEAHNNMGWAYMQKGEQALAEVNLKKAIRLNKNYCPAYCNLGELSSQKGNRREAIEHYNKAISICPQNYARPHFLLAVEYGRLGHFDRACAEFAAASKVPDAPEAEQAVKYMRLYNCPGVVHE